MSAAAEAVRNLGRMGVSSMCRDGNHKTCSQLKMVCSCDCHGEAGQTPTRIEPKSRRARTTEHVPAEHLEEAAAVKTDPPPKEPKTPAKATAKRKPLVERVRNCPPPQRERKQYVIPLKEQVRPVLEEILIDGDREWNRVVLCFSARQAGANIKRLREHYSAKEWEWDYAQVDETDQSAIYVRWIGNQGALL